VPCAVIAVRELTIQGFRSFWARRGLAVPATTLAKVKTVVQQLAVGFALCPPVANNVLWFATGLLWVAVVLTVVTGYQYVTAGSRMATTSGSR
jgi:phosphatidylglycerophosphate synthase